MQFHLRLLFALLAASLAPGAPAQFAPPLWPGPQPDGTTLLPNGWSLRPAGHQVPLGDFPVAIAVHPSSLFAAVLHAGCGPHEIVVLDVRAARIVMRQPLAETFYGLEFSRDGTKLFASGAGGEVVYQFDFVAGKLVKPRSLRLHPAAVRGVPAGLAVDAAARTLFAANLWKHSVTRLDLTGKVPTLEIPLAPTTSAATNATPASDDADTAAATKRALAEMMPADPAAAHPYACRLDEKQQRLYVSLWAQAAVAVVDLKSNQVVARWPVEEHPCEMVLTRSGKFLFVANANRNTVSVLDTSTGRVVETIWAALYPNAPLGSTPNSLALTPDETLLFVANANVNAVAVFDVAKPGKSRALGFVPVGWYPTSVRVTPDGRSLLVANGKGQTSRANPRGPQPVRGASTEEYIAKLLRGSLSVIPLPDRPHLLAALPALTATALACSPLRPDAGVAVQPPAGHPIPWQPGGPSPIKYCIYILKENRTYDQVFGDILRGNGAPELCLFGERVTPNHHQLAREFVLLDNFYVESEVSADGHEWSVGAYATDFVEKTWPLSYGHNKSGKHPYPSEGNLAIALPSSGYLWDQAAKAGVSYRSYGEFVANGKTPNEPGRAKVKSLEGHFDPGYRSFDMDYPDVERADRFIDQLQRYEATGDLPRLQIVRLPNDHTHGVTPGKRTPTAYVADNDLALGRIVEAVSHSRYWAETAIFVVEDDAQNGPDHVDAHRTVALVISPWTRRRAVDSTLYTTCSMLRTMELILGLPPMTQFDAAAMPMFNSFTTEPAYRPYTALPARVDLDEQNGRYGWGAKQKFNFAREDAADDLLLNEVIWRSVKGADQPMPAPVRAAFVRPLNPDQDDD